MARPCSICGRPDVKEINRRLRNNENIKEMSSTYGVSTDIIYRHAKHMDKTEAKEGETTVAGNSTLERITELENTARALAKKAEKAGNLQSAATLLKVCGDNIQLAARLRGEMSRPIEKTESGTEEFRRFLSDLLEALDNNLESKAIVLSVAQKMRAKPRMEIDECLIT
jgi:hypothetical protein